jgi:hypothetical protein
MQVRCIANLVVKRVKCSIGLYLEFNNRIIRLARMTFAQWGTAYKMHMTRRSRVTADWTTFIT